jgi:hypothetical protein
VRSRTSAYCRHAKCWPHYTPPLTTMIIVGCRRTFHRWLWACCTRGLEQPRLWRTGAVRMWTGRGRNGLCAKHEHVDGGGGSAAVAEPAERREHPAVGESAFGQIGVQSDPFRARPGSAPRACTGGSIAPRSAPHRGSARDAKARPHRRRACFVAGTARRPMKSRSSSPSAPIWLSSPGSSTAAPRRPVESVDDKFRILATRTLASWHGPLLARSGLYEGLLLAPSGHHSRSGRSSSKRGGRRLST